MATVRDEFAEERLATPIDGLMAHLTAERETVDLLIERLVRIDHAIETLVRTTADLCEAISAPTALAAAR